MVGDDMAKWGTGSWTRLVIINKCQAPAMIDRTSEWRCFHVPVVNGGWFDLGSEQVLRADASAKGERSSKSSRGEGGLFRT